MPVEKLASSRVGTIAPMVVKRWVARARAAAVARGLGVEAFSAANIKEYREALALAAAVDGPSLIDVQVDPSGYLKQSIALRG